MSQFLLENLDDFQILFYPSIDKQQVKWLLQNWL